MIQSALLVMLAWLIVNGVDRVMSWQTFARPIVTAAITGLVLGDLTTGVVMGASLEAIFMGISAIGGSVPADACSASIIAVAMTILTGVDTETGLALAMPIGTLMATVGEMYKPVLASLAPYWEHLAGTGNIKSFRIQTILCGLFVDRLPQTIERARLFQVVFRHPVILLKGLIADILSDTTRLEWRADAVAVVGQSPRHYLHSFFRRSFRCVPRPRR